MRNALTPTPDTQKPTNTRTPTETLTLMQPNENCIPIERLLTKHSKRAVFCVCFGMRIKMGMGMGLESVLESGLWPAKDGLGEWRGPVAGHMNHHNDKWRWYRGSADFIVRP